MARFSDRYLKQPLATKTNRTNSGVWASESPLKGTNLRRTKRSSGDVAGGVAREVTTQGGAAIPLGATLKGSIEKCVQPSSAEDRSELLLKFTEVAIPGQGSVKLTGHVSGVTNARETVQEDGTIMGVLKTEAPVSLLGGVLQKIGAANPTIGKEIQKQKIGEVNTAIDYAAGTDLQFTLTQPLA